MRILIGEVLTESHPNLVRSLEDFEPDWSVEVWVPSSTIAGSVDLVSRFRPDIIVVRQQSLVFAPVMRRIIDASDCDTSVLVVGHDSVNTSLKIQAAYYGFFDVLDLGESDNDICTNLHRIGAGVSKLDTDQLWNSIDRPSPVADVSLAPHDEWDLSILELIRMGLVDRDIVEVVGMSAQTVRNRVSAMLNRCGLDNRTHMAWAFTHAGLTEVLFQGFDQSTR